MDFGERKGFGEALSALKSSFLLIMFAGLSELVVQAEKQKEAPTDSENIVRTKGIHLPRGVL